MAKINAILRFHTLTDGNLEALAGSILTCMTNDSTDFPSPAPTLDVLSAALKTFSESIVAAQLKDKVSMLKKKAARKALQIVLSALAAYVNFTAPDNENRASIIAKAGFITSAQVKTPAKLGKIENFTVEMGKNSGEVILRINPVDNSTGYIYCWAISPVINDAWTHKWYSFSSFTFTGLPAGKEIAFKVGATGSKHQSDYSSVITRIVS